MARRRRLLAALCAAVAVAAGLHAAQTPPVDTTAVVAAASDISPGQTVQADDLVRVDLPTDAVPADAATQVESFAGERAASLIGAGEVLTPARLVSADLSAEPGHQVMPVRLPDAATASLLQAGDRIDLVSANPQRGGAEVVVSDVAVVGLGHGGKNTQGTRGRVVLLGLPARAIARVAESVARDYLTFAYSR